MSCINKTEFLGSKISHFQISYNQLHDNGHPFMLSSDTQPFSNVCAWK